VDPFTERNQMHFRDRGMPAKKDLCRRIHLIIVGAVGKRRALFEEIVHPGEHLRMRNINVTGFDQWTDRGRPADLSARWVHRNDAGDLIHQHLDNG
jgi:hypothetical protein